MVRILFLYGNKIRGLFKEERLIDEYSLTFISNKFRKLNINVLILSSLHKMEYKVRINESNRT